MNRIPPWFAALALALLASPAGAAVFVVDTNADGADTDPGDTFCDADALLGGNQCTLRAAVMESNALDGADTIQLPTGTFALTIPDFLAPDNATTGDLDVQEGGLTIEGAAATGAVASVIEAKKAKHRAFDSFGELTLRDLAVINGKVSPKTDPIGIGQGSGGCIRARVALTLERVVLSDCSADPDGGALAQIGGALTIMDSTISENSAKQDGGGVKLNPTFTSIERSLIASNKAGDEGGGLAITSGFVDVFNSTFSGNSAKTEGGAILNEVDGDLALVHVTLTGNKAKQGAVIHVNDTLNPPTTTVANSIFDSRKGNNCHQSLATMIVSLGGNLDSGSSCGFAAAQDFSDLDPLLEPLTDNGGPTLTHALDSNSPAVDRTSANCESEDQRGTARAAPCDAGAFELP